LTNLLENAAKYTDPGTPITLRAYINFEKIHVEVHDSGPGISSDMLGQMFEKFVRGKDSQHRSNGSGLGLAICKGILIAHGGMIWVEQRPQGGSCFVFVLPMLPIATVDPPDGAILRSDREIVS
jgi:signal transduction histidine kinase